MRLFMHGKLADDFVMSYNAFVDRVGWPHAKVGMNAMPNSLKTLRIFAIVLGCGYGAAFAATSGPNVEVRTEGSSLRVSVRSTPRRAVLDHLFKDHQVAVSWQDSNFADEAITGEFRGTVAQVIRQLLGDSNYVMSYQTLVYRELWPARVLILGKNTGSEQLSGSRTAGGIVASPISKLEVSSVVGRTANPQKEAQGTPHESLPPRSNATVKIAAAVEMTAPFVTESRQNSVNETERLPGVDIDANGPLQTPALAAPAANMPASVPLMLVAVPELPGSNSDIAVGGRSKLPGVD